MIFANWLQRPGPANPQITFVKSAYTKALFSAIERQNIQEVRTLLALSDVNVNELNRDRFTPLDVALMTGAMEFVDVLLNHGALESPDFSDPAIRAKHLERLIEEADKSVNELTATIVNCIGDVKDNEKQLRDWEWRLYMLRIMQNGFLSADRPTERPSVSVAPLSNNSLMVAVSRLPQETDGKDVITKYKVEWSRVADFSLVEGHKIITDRRQQICTITGLDKNMPWYTRAQCGNLKGFGVYGYPDPISVVPSSWHECDESLPRYYAASDRLGQLLDDLHGFQSRSFEKVDGDSSSEEETVSPVQNNAKPRKKMMKSLSKYTHLIFNSAPKLLKKIKSRGIYLAALLYSDDGTRVMVTMDENLPVVEVDDNYSKSFSHEFYWLFKTSCTWEDIEHMLYISSKANSSPSVLIRRKLLHSALALQTATGITNLGPLHFQPFKDSHGSILLLAVNCIKKSSSHARSVNMKWLAIHKLVKRCIGATNDHALVPERLIPSVQQQVHTHKRSRTCLPRLTERVVVEMAGEQRKLRNCGRSGVLFPDILRILIHRGLYVGYLKLRTSVDTLSVVVPNSHTSVLPFVKIRDVPNVSREEWMYLRQLHAGVNGFHGTLLMSLRLERVTKETPVSSTLSTFREKLKSSISRLLFQVGAADETFPRHGLFVHEVVELNSDVLFLLLVPPREDLCTLPGQADHFSKSNSFCAVPLQAFEMLCMMAYQPDLITAYSRLSSSIELDLLSTQQCSREALSSTDAQRLRERLSRLSEIQHSVDDCWKRSRWVVDHIQVCKDRSSKSTLALSSIFDAADFSVPAGIQNSLGRGSQEEMSFSSSFDEKGGNLVTVFGSPELGLPSGASAEVLINEDTTAENVIHMVAEQFATLVLERSKEDGDGSELSCFSADARHQLGLVVVADSHERSLRDDLRLLEVHSSWEKGALHLCLKKNSLLVGKIGSSTEV